MPETASRRGALAPSLLFLVILAAAAALRFWGLDQGLPFLGARPDEREAVEHTVGFPAGDLNPRWFVYPNLFFWVVWLWEEGALALRRLGADTPGYATMVREHMAPLLLYGRVLSALLGTATVGLVWTIGRRLGGERLALVAALLVAVSFLHVRESHALKADVFLAAGVLVSLAALARWVERPSRARAVAAGVAIGITTALKYPGILLLGPAYLAGVLASRRAGLRRLVPAGNAILLATIALATFLAGSPYLVLDFGHARETAQFSARAVYGTRPHSVQAARTRLGKARAWLASRTFGYHALVSLRHGAGLAFALVTPLALAAGWWRPRHPFLPLAAAFCVLYYLAVGISPVHQSRYVTPLVPLLALLVADLLERLAARVPEPTRRNALVAGLALALAAEPAASSIAYDRIAARTDTRVLATDWMAEHLPPGAVVAELGSIVFAVADPDLPPGIIRAPLPFGATDFASYGVTHVLTHEHQLPFSSLLDRQMQAIAPHLRPLAEFTPYRDGPAGEFEREDAYYVPLAGFSGVVRPGPLVRIYAYEAPP